MTKLTLASSVDGIAGRLAARRKGRPLITAALVAPLHPNPPAQSYGGSTGAIANLHVVSTIANGALIPWTDARFGYLGGVPQAWTSAGYGAALATIAGANPLASPALYRDGRVGWIEFDVECSAFELCEYANASQWSTLWIDGLPVSSEPVAQSSIATLTNGLLYLRRVDFGARGHHTVRLYQEAMLFGGVYLALTDTLHPPSTGDSLTHLHVGDSYSTTGINGISNDTNRAQDNYVFRMQRRLGIANLWCDGFGGTGVVATQGGTVPAYGTRSAGWPSAADVVTVQGSINDSAMITAVTLTAAALQAATVTLLQQLRTAYPAAPIVLFGIVRPGNPTAGDTTANGAYSAAVTATADANITFVDAIAAGWFAGTGKVGATTGDGNADVCLSSDGNHPSTEGHLVLGDRCAAAVSAATSIPILDARFEQSAATLVSTGKKTWSAQAQGSFILREDGAGTVSASAGTPMEGAFWLDPADTPTLKLRGLVATNSTAPTSTFTFSLVAITSGSGDGAGAVGVTVGATIAAATAVAAPGADSITKVDSAEFACPAAGMYAVQLVISVANMAANSAAVTRYRLLATRVA